VSATEGSVSAGPLRLQRKNDPQFLVIARRQPNALVERNPLPDRFYAAVAADPIHPLMDHTI
jgi:hypothetical protein